MSNSFFYKDDDFSQLKRKLYFILLPILSIVFGVVWYILSVNYNMTFINILTFASLCLGFTIGFVLLFVTDDLRYVEGFVFLVGTLVYVLRFFYNVIVQLGVDNQTHLGTLTYWVSLLYIILYITFRGKKALVLSLVIYGVTLVPGVYHVIYSPFVSGYTLDALIQFYVSNLAYIIALYYLQKVIEVYLHAETAKQIANTDFLTNLPNRRYMDKLLHEEMEKVNKGKLKDLSIILFDVDRFKQVNDTYGHEIGDIILKDVARFVEQNIRDTDHFGRWGGEEFLIIAANKNLPSTAVFAERLRGLIESHTFKETASLTCSFGVAQYKPSNDLARDLLKRADKALYRAKESGRNLVDSED